MTQAGKYVAAVPILKAAILGGKTMTEAADAAEISRNTADAYRRRAEKAEGKTWAEQLDTAIGGGAAPSLQQLADLIGRRLAHAAERQPTAEEMVADSDGLVKLGSIHIALLKRIDEVKDRANDPEILLRALDGFRQWLQRELAAGRLPEAMMDSIRVLYERYTADLSSGRFEVTP